MKHAEGTTLFWTILKYKASKNKLCRVSSYLSAHFLLFQSFLDVLEPFPAVRAMEAQQWPQAGSEAGEHKFVEFTGKKKENKINTTNPALDLFSVCEMKTPFIAR